jgi:hypothetical protein
MAPLTEGYRYRVVPSSYGGVEQRWVLIHSEPRQPQAQRTVDKQWHKQSAHEVKAFQTLCRKAFACEAEAHQALAHFAHALQTTLLSDRTVCPTPQYGKLIFTHIFGFCDSAGIFKEEKTDSSNP